MKLENITSNGIADLEKLIAKLQNEISSYQYSMTETHPTPSVEYGALPIVINETSANN